VKSGPLIAEIETPRGESGGGRGGKKTDEWRNCFPTRKNLMPAKPGRPGELCHLFFLRLLTDDVILTRGFGKKGKQEKKQRKVGHREKSGTVKAIRPRPRNAVDSPQAMNLSGNGKE